MVSGVGWAGARPGSGRWPAGVERRASRGLRLRMVRRGTRGQRQAALTERLGCRPTPPLCPAGPEKAKRLPLAAARVPSQRQRASDRNKRRAPAPPAGEGMSGHERAVGPARGSAGE